MKLSALSVGKLITVAAGIGFCALMLPGQTHRVTKAGARVCSLLTNAGTSVFSDTISGGWGPSSSTPTAATLVGWNVAGTKLSVHLTWELMDNPDTTLVALQGALQKWVDTDAVTFEQSSTNPSIKVTWNHTGCPFPFQPNELAHTFYPGSGSWTGQIHLNSNANWNGVDLQSVIAHELGHALGLQHLADPTALMFAQYHFGSNPRLPDQTALNELYLVRFTPGGQFTESGSFQ
jgi:hypothetical protein